MFEKYHDLKRNLRQFGSFKILSLREGWSFQRRKTEPITNQAVTSTSERPCWESNMTWPSWSDLRTRVLKGSGLQACCLPGPLALTQIPFMGTGSPSFSHPPPGAPILWAPGSSHSSHPFTPPSLHHLWALSLPPTPGHVLTGNLPSGVDGWLGDRALPSLWDPTFFPLQWLCSCFHGNRAWWTLFSLTCLHY